MTVATVVIRERDRTWRVGADRCTVGSGSSCDVVLDSARVGVWHAVFEVRGGRLFVVDLGTEHGTFVNARPVERPTPVEETDSVTIGDFTLRAELDDDEQPPATDRIPSVGVIAEPASAPPATDSVPQALGQWDDDEPEPLTPRIMEPIEPVEDEFLDGLRADPDNDEIRAVYADWLEERGQRLKAEFLRLQCRLAKASVGSAEASAIDERLRAISPSSDAWWRAITSRPRIERCNVRFALKCPKRWSSLAPTGSPTVRHCGVCRCSVHYCASLTEVLSRAAASECVAFDPSLVRGEALEAYERASLEDTMIEVGRVTR